MPLPHYTNLSNVGSPGGPGTFPDEVVYLNLFEITFVLPEILKEQGRNDLLLLENATKISFGSLTDFGITNVQQRFKYSTREFLTTPNKTSGELTIPVQVNVNQSLSMETWSTLKAWYDIVFNSQNGYMHYKSDIIGNIIANQHDKKGYVIRRVSFINCQIQTLQGYDLDWSAQNIIQTLDAKFVYDYFIDEYFDQGYVVSDPNLISGY